VSVLLLCLGVRLLTADDWRRTQIYHASFNNVGDIVFLAGGDGYITLAEYPSLSLLERIGSHVRACTSLDFDPRGRYLATGGEDALVNLYDTSEWMCIRTISSAEYVHAGWAYE
jgi:THO complex subunit 3